MSSTPRKHSFASLAAAIVVAALSCGAEPALATLLTLPSQNFSLTASVPGNFTVDVTNGGSTDDPSVTKSFAQFDTLGGTLTLNSVKIVISTTSTSLSAAIISFDCDLDGCSGDAMNSSTFEVTVDGLLPLSQGPFSQTASVTCGLVDDCEPDTANPLSDTPAALHPSLTDFTFNLSSGLGAFIGSGTFDVTPDLSLAALFNALGLSNTGGDDNGTQMTTDSAWGGTITVTYDYTAPTNGVPEPASLVLIGTALAVLGFSRSRRKKA